MFIETERMWLRPFQPDDAGDLYRIRSQPAVTRYLGSGPAQTRVQVVRRLHTYLSHYRQYGFGMWAVIDKATGHLIGNSGLFKQQRIKEIEIGFGFDQAYWGQGRATEVAAACLAYGFGTLKLPAVAALAYPQNLASRRVLEKIGLSYYQTIIYQGASCVCYRIEHAGELS